MVRRIRGNLEALCIKNKAKKTFNNRVSLPFLLDKAALSENQSKIFIEMITNIILVAVYLIQVAKKAVFHFYPHLL